MLPDVVQMFHSRLGVCERSVLLRAEGSIQPRIQSVSNSSLAHDMEEIYVVVFLCI